MAYCAIKNKNQKRWHQQNADNLIFFKKREKFLRPRGHLAWRTSQKSGAEPDLTVLKN